MSGHTALLNVGKTLINLLWESISKDDEIKSIVTSKQQIAMVSPEEAVDDVMLSIFLYQVTEDTFRKNQPVKAVDLKVLQKSAIYLNLFYVITPNTKNGENDLRLIGKVAQVFNDNQMLQGPILQGDLGQDGEDLKLIFNPMSLDDINKIWVVISKSKPYKQSLYYEVTPVRIDSTLTQAVTRVTERDITYLEKGLGARN